MISKNRLKYIRSLRNKKSRDKHRQFVVEGDKIILDLISKIAGHGIHPGTNQEYATGRPYPNIRQLIVTSEWLDKNPSIQWPGQMETVEISSRDYLQITSQESPPGIMAVMDMPEPCVPDETLPSGLSVALETIQDPGNLGTIIRTASWFGLQRVYCSEDCADCYNPKAVQSSMGAVLYTPVCYTSLTELLRRFDESKSHTVYGTFLEGSNLWEVVLNQNALIVFGNESRGISSGLLPWISERLSIPHHPEHSIVTTHPSIESLNVAASVAIVVANFRNPNALK